MKFDKVKNKKKKANRKKWWIIKTKNYEIPLYYLWLAPFVIVYDKLYKYSHSKRKWSDEKANKVLDKFLSKALTWSEEDNYYYINFRKWGCWYYSKRFPLGSRKWVWKFSSELRDYLINKYENPLYIKTVEDDYDWWLIIFKEKA